MKTEGNFLSPHSISPIPKRLQSSQHLKRYPSARTNPGRSTPISQHDGRARPDVNHNKTSMNKRNLLLAANSPSNNLRRKLLCVLGSIYLELSPTSRAVQL